MNSWPTLSEVISTGIASSLRELGKSLPGTVVSYDPATETAVVRPGIHKLVPRLETDEEDEVEELPALVNVPVAWYRARGVSIVGSLSPNDSVLLVCCDRDIAAWRRTGAPSEPDDARVHSWSSAVALPGLQADVRRFPAPTDAAALASKVDNLIRALKTAAADAAVVAALNTNFPGITGAPVAELPGVLTTGSSILKVDE